MSLGGHRQSLRASFPERGWSQGLKLLALMGDTPFSREEGYLLPNSSQRGDTT